MEKFQKIYLPETPFMQRNSKCFIPQIVKPETNEKTAGVGGKCHHDIKNYLSEQKY